MTASFAFALTMDDRMELIVIILLVVYSAIAIIGFTGNLIIVIITIKNRNLQSSCNIFIAISSFFDCLLYTDVAVFVFSMFQATSQEMCFFISIPADIGAFSSNFCLLIIGIDRLIAVTKPSYYNTLDSSKKYYVSLFVLLPLIYSSILLVLAFDKTDSGKSVVCLVPESLGPVYNYFAISSLFLNFFVPFIYIYVFLRVNKVAMKSSAKSVFRSLVIIVFMAVFGWMMTNFFGVLTVVIPMSNQIATMIKLSCGVFIFTSSAFNIFVYYNMCKDYRGAILRLFGRARIDAIDSRSVLQTT